MALHAYVSSLRKCLSASVRCSFLAYIRKKNYRMCCWRKRSWLKILDLHREWLNLYLLEIKLFPENSRSALTLLRLSALVQSANLKRPNRPSQYIKICGRYPASEFVTVVITLLPLESYIKATVYVETRYVHFTSCVSLPADRQGGLLQLWWWMQMYICMPICNKCIWNWHIIY